MPGCCWVRISARWPCCARRWSRSTGSSPCGSATSSIEGMARFVCREAVEQERRIAYACGRHVGEGVLRCQGLGHACSIGCGHHLGRDACGAGHQQGVAGVRAWRPRRRSVRGIWPCRSRAGSSGRACITPSRLAAQRGVCDGVTVPVGAQKTKADMGRPVRKECIFRLPHHPGE